MVFNLLVNIIETGNDAADDNADNIIPLYESKKCTCLKGEWSELDTLIPHLVCFRCRYLSKGRVAGTGYTNPSFSMFLLYLSKGGERSELDTLIPHLYVSVVGTCLKGEWQELTVCFCCRYLSKGRAAGTGCTNPSFSMFLCQVPVQGRQQELDTNPSFSMFLLYLSKGRVAGTGCTNPSFSIFLFVTGTCLRESGTCLKGEWQGTGYTNPSFSMFLLDVGTCLKGEWQGGELDTLIPHLVCFCCRYLSKEVAGTGYTNPSFQYVSVVGTCLKGVAGTGYTNPSFSMFLL
ncbi:unnamed protein product [Mytilus edulis]|uniref:Uncharacterized protein n=1 Tax=Mytilus edulis TaxID=6550 RepID=A0A8S3PVB2_MYTED|nr:unnamed protein product [Mytilus edulis]